MTKPTKPVSPNAYRNLRKIAKQHAELMAVARRDGLAKIAARRNIIVREDAIGAYCEARFWAHEYARRLASVHPDKTLFMTPQQRRAAAAGESR